MKQPEYEIRLLQVAEDDLREIINYIALDDPAVATTLLDKIENSLSGLISFPLLGKIPAEEALAGMGYRFLTVNNYLVFYTVKEQIIWVHRIIHGVRNYISLL